MKDFLKVVDACDDIQVVKNVVNILIDGMQKGMKETSLFATIKVAYSELVGCHYSEELAELYYRCEGLDSKVWDAAKLAYTQEIQANYPDVPLYDWTILYGRMSRTQRELMLLLRLARCFLIISFLLTLI